MRGKERKKEGEWHMGTKHNQMADAGAHEKWQSLRSSHELLMRCTWCTGFCSWVHQRQPAMTDELRWHCCTA